MKQHKWTLLEQATFLKRVGELLARGYPVAEAMESVSFQLPPSKKAELAECLVALKKGLTFHEVIAALGFQSDLIGYVYFAEQHGSFAEALLEGSGLALRKAKDMHSLSKLLQYPLVLIIITGFLFIFVEKMLLPRFTSLFASMNLKANLFTKIVYAFGHYFPTVVFALFIFLVLLGAYYWFIFRKISVLQQKSLLASLPLIGNSLKLLYTHYFSTQLSFLLSGGISFSEALLLFEKNKNQPLYSELSKQIKLKLVTGEHLESILSSFSFFEKEFPLIVKHGQENGKLDQELLFYSQHCIVLLEEKVEKSLKTIQPILYLFIGFLVVSMYLAILLPMFHLMDGI
ncbi:MAG: competence type IV pilus assembly protein ComGB [Bacillota bacterium]|nr:competence type IV pilus assembly protein ComGB [Bacillota bacterium]